MKNNNFKVNKSVLNYIHAKDFWQPGDAEKYKQAVKHLQFVPKQYGYEIQDFNMVDPELDMVFSSMLGEWVEVREKYSGVFRIPSPGVHFEDFDSLNEWSFAIAVEDNQFITYSHKSGAKSALDNHRLDYTKSIDWNIESIINIKQNDCIFYRPWVFHSFEPRLIQYFKIMGMEED